MISSHCTEVSYFREKNSTKKNKQTKPIQMSYQISHVCMGAKGMQVNSRGGAEGQAKCVVLCQKVVHILLVHPEKMALSCMAKKGQMEKSRKDTFCRKNRIWKTSTVEEGNTEVKLSVDITVDILQLSFLLSEEHHMHFCFFSVIWSTLNVPHVHLASDLPCTTESEQVFW